ncbi:MAG: carbohydrate binding domain-containing protein [Wujia sp.]
MLRRKSAISIAIALCVASTSVPVNVFAADPDIRIAEEDVLQSDAGDKTLSYENYSLAWQDEFEGTTLNREDWNVELHEKGWVNNELQEYVDSEDNIQVKDGMLYINPVKHVTSIAGKENKFVNPAFTSELDGWTETIAIPAWGEGFVADASHSFADGAIVYDIKNPGTDNWHVQLKQEGIKLEAGKTYTVRYNITSTADRSFLTGVQNATTYNPYAESAPALTANTPQTVVFEFTMSEDDENATFYISLGKMAEGETPASVVTISDLMMIEGSAADLDSTEESHDEVSYTSGRISTQNKQAFTYGLYEVRAKVPEGQGFLPAFWLMAEDENVYGQWPRCGEIDCMEVMGQDTSKVYGTIHYGNPHSESQGTYTLGETDSFSDNFHTFSCEWEPGVIRWYVDGVLYHEESDWYSTTEGQGTLTYPAPFDQPFYIILNLAVGGSWVGNPDDTTSFDNNPYVIDYVKVYQKESYDENVTRPEKEVILRDPDANGNYVNNGDFAVAEALDDEQDWKFMTALSGEATAEIKDNAIAIKTANEGTVDYSVQLVQPNIPLQKGARYEVSFDAYASADREMNVDIKAPDYGYKSYMPTKVAALTTEKQKYTYEFEMKSDSDANGRLEYNMGAAGSTADIYISNVVIKKTADPDPNAVEEKTVLANGNYIYNGSFQEGDNHLGYWEYSAENADVTVTGFSDGRRLKISAQDTEKDAVVNLGQTALAFKEGAPYTLSFKAQADVDSTVEVVLGGNKYPVAVSGDNKNQIYSVTIPDTVSFADKDISFEIRTKGVVSLDNMSLVESALIKNGSFNDGLTGFEVYVDSSAKASYVVDSLKEDNALDVTVNNTGDADWKIQIKQNNVPLENGKKYELRFKAKSTLGRSIRVIMQGTESKGWAVYSNDNIVKLTDEYQTFTDVFEMTADTDEEAFLSICLGNVDEIITDQHRVVIDDISLVEHVHTVVTDPAVDPTCMAEGLTEGCHCSVCGEILAAQEPVAKVTHNYAPTVIKATTTKNGSIIKKCTMCGDVESETVIARPKKISLSKTVFNYNGKVQKPEIKVIDINGKEIASSNYTVKYQSGCKNAGTYKISVVLKGNYSGTMTKTFKIIPVRQYITSRFKVKTFMQKNVAKSSQSIWIGARAKTKLSYVSSNKKYVTVTETGKVTVKKGAPKGIYTITVTAAASGNYKQANKTIKIVVK